MVRDTCSDGKLGSISVQFILFPVAKKQNT